MLLNAEVLLAGTFCSIQAMARVFCVGTGVQRPAETAGSFRSVGPVSIFALR